MVHVGCGLLSRAGAIVLYRIQMKRNTRRPISVLETMEADYCVTLKYMHEAIKHIFKNATESGHTPPDNIVVESRLSEKVATGIEDVIKLGAKSLYSCPDCGGGTYYYCHICH